MSDELEGLNLIELYDRLILPAAPEPVSMWPQTVGWYWLMAALVVVIGLAVWRTMVWRRATAYRRAAFAALKNAGDDPAAIAVVLRRTALAAFPREEVASLYGKEWLNFLDRVGGGPKFADSGAGQVLAAAPYKPQQPQAELVAIAEQWIRTHSNDRPHA